MSSTRTFIREHPIAAVFFFFLATVMGLWILAICYFTFSFVNSSSCTFERRHDAVVGGVKVEVAYEDCMGLITSSTYVAVRAFSPGEGDGTVVFRCDCSDVEIEQVGANSARLVVPAERTTTDAPLQAPPLWLLHSSWQGVIFTYVLREVGSSRSPKSEQRK
jgi:hypothetical protein